MRNVLTKDILTVLKIQVYIETISYEFLSLNNVQNLMFTCKYYITTDKQQCLTECFVPRCLLWHKIGHVPSYSWLLSSLSQHYTQLACF